MDMSALMKYIHQAENVGKEAPGLSEKLKGLFSSGIGMAKSHPEVTAGLGGAAAGYGASELMDDSEPEGDEDDAVNLDEDSILKKYMRR